MAMCDMCENYRYDEDLEEYFCDIELDEDEYLKFLTSSNDACPYFRADDEYRIVRKDGEIRYINDYGYLTKSDDIGEPFFYVFLLDVTDTMK